MKDEIRTLELLSPAKNAEIGIEAIRHGADAVYIGGPAFGARAGAGNPVSDIERLAAHAHRFHAKVFVALNTIFDDAEIEQAAKLAHEFWNAGADALIVQDMGLLECDLPPIQLHASTQCDVRTVEKARFLADVGFSQIVLAREMTLQDVRRVHAALKVSPGGDHGRPADGLKVSPGGTARTHPVALEYFIHGALCVAFSGQCYISHAHTGRSANRGECAQACRLPYNLEDGQGRVVAYDKHLLSMKDNDQSANLRLLAEAGIRSFKIEGRLKDVAYVKNATAHYRRLIDALLEESAGDPAPWRRASSGRSVHLFTPQPEKTFNRGSTDYFAHGRGADIAAFDTPKFAGEPVGEVVRTGPDWIDIAATSELHNGDGISWLAGRRSAGARVNTVAPAGQATRVQPNEMPSGDALPRPGATIYRNRDQAFERQLEKASAERHIGVTLTLEEDAVGFVLRAVDEDGIAAAARVDHDKQPSKQPEKTFVALGEQLCKLGNTDFRAGEMAVRLAQPWFIPASVANALRRDAIAALISAREAARPRPPRAAPREPPAQYPETSLSYLGNVFNARARAFYEKHGVRIIADAYEADTTTGEVSLMITKHCLRYSYSLCPKEAKGWVKGVNAEPMTLVNGKERMTLRFDCKACEMHVMGKLRKHRSVPIKAVAPH